MSISDWSSDVCSSDLSLRQQVREESLECERQLLAGTVDRMALGVIHLGADGSVLDMNGEARRILDARDGILLSPAGLSSESLQDRKRVVEGKRVAVRVALGGSRFIKKKKTKTH